MNNFVKRSKTINYKHTKQSLTKNIVVALCILSFIPKSFFVLLLSLLSSLLHTFVLVNSTCRIFFILQEL